MAARLRASRICSLDLLSASKRSSRAENGSARRFKAIFFHGDDGSADFRSFHLSSHLLAFAASFRSQSITFSRFFGSVSALKNFISRTVGGTPVVSSTSRRRK